MNPQQALPSDVLGARFRPRPASVLDSYPAAVIRTSAPLLCVDAAALFLALGAAVAIAWPNERIPVAGDLLFVALGAVVPGFLAFAGLYPGAPLGPVEEFRRVTIGASLAFAAHAIAAAGFLGVETPWKVVVL